MILNYINKIDRDLRDQEIGHCPADPGQKRVNMTGTDQKNSTQAARGRSGPVLYEIVSREGIVQPGGFTTASRAFEYASRLWPDQEQDEDRTGKGWDVQVVGCDQ